MFDGIRPHKHAVSFDTRICPDEFTVFSGNGKAVQLFAFDVKSLTDVGKTKADLIPFDLHGFVHRSGCDTFSVVGEAFRFTGDTVAECLLIRRMNIRMVADVDGHRHSGVRNVQRCGLYFPQHCPVAVGRLTVLPEVIHETDPRGMAFKCGKLDKNERHGRVMPFCAPVFDQQREQCHVVLISSGVGFPLIPDHALDRINGPRGDHGVVKSCGELRGAERVVRGDSRTGTDLFGIDLEFQFALPVAVETDTLCRIGTALDIDQIGGRNKSPVAERVDYTDRDGVFSGFDQFAGNRVHALVVPVIRSVGTDAADFDAVEECFVTVVNGSERKTQVFVRPACRKIDVAAEPDNTVDFRINNAGNFDRCPGRDIIFGILPVRSGFGFRCIGRMEFFVPCVKCRIGFITHGFQACFFLVDRLRILGGSDLSQFSGTVDGLESGFADPGFDTGSAPA